MIRRDFNSEGDAALYRRPRFSLGVIITFSRTIVRFTCTSTLFAPQAVLHRGIQDQPSQPLENLSKPSGVSVGLWVPRQGKHKQRQADSAVIAGGALRGELCAAAFLYRYCVTWTVDVSTFRTWCTWPSELCVN